MKNALIRTHPFLFLQNMSTSFHWCISHLRACIKIPFNKMWSLIFGGWPSQHLLNQVSITSLKSSPLCHYVPPQHFSSLKSATCRVLQSHRNIMFHAEPRQSMTNEICKPFHEVFEGAHWYDNIVEKTVPGLTKTGGKPFLNDEIMKLNLMKVTRITEFILNIGLEVPGSSFSFIANIQCRLAQ